MKTTTTIKTGLHKNLAGEHVWVTGRPDYDTENTFIFMSSVDEYGSLTRIDEFTCKYDVGINLLTDYQPYLELTKYTEEEERNIVDEMRKNVEQRYEREKLKQEEEARIKEEEKLKQYEKIKNMYSGDLFPLCQNRCQESFVIY